VKRFVDRVVRGLVEAPLSDERPMHTQNCCQFNVSQVAGRWFAALSGVTDGTW